jgi:RNA polymerase sigma-70 factor (ECF subfamily)
VTEKQLIERCRQGEGKALKTLYERYADRMLGVCFRYVADRDTARDLLHDGFVTLFTRIGDFRGEGSFEGWMRRIFVTTALSYLRRNGNGAVDRWSEAHDPGDPEASALEQLSAAELLKLIGCMPEGYRTVLNLYAVEGYTHREIAELLGISENTSRSQYARAKTCLRKAMQQRDGTK